MLEAANLLISAMGSSFLEALDLIESDPDAWCHLRKFDLPEEQSTEGNVNSSPVQPQAPPQQQALTPASQPAGLVPKVTESLLDGHTISDQSRGSWRELTPISPAQTSGALALALRLRCSSG